MTLRSPVSAIKPIWYNAEQVDETDLSTQQTADATIESSIINNHIGTGILPTNLVNNILFNSNLVTGFLDGLAVFSQNQPSDKQLGNQLSISLSGSQASVYRTVKVCIIGLDFQNNLQYETFYFKANEVQVTIHHYTQILLLLFNDIKGNATLSFNLGGQLLISEALPLELSRSAIMLAQDIQPNLFFRDFFIDPSLGPISLQTLLQSALPLYNVSDLNINTQPLDNLVLQSGDVTTQIGQKFQAVTNNIQKVSLLLSVRNLIAGQQNNLVWTGDLIVSIYPLQTTLNCPTDLAPGLPINFSPSNIPVAQVSFNYNTLQSVGVVLDSVPQPIDFIFSNTPAALGSLVQPNNYYAVTVKRSGNANQCDILIAVGSDEISNSNATTFTGNLWVDLPNEDLWFRIWTDASKVSDGQAYDTGNGVIIPKTTTDPNTEATVDYSFGPQSFIGSDTFSAVLTAVNAESVPVPDARTGEPVNSRQQLEPNVALLGTIDITNLEKSTEPLVLGTIVDKNIKTFITGSNSITSKLYSATLVNNSILIRVVDDPTDTVRFDTTVTGLISNLLNGNLVSAQMIPNDASPSLNYRVANTTLCSMIVGDVNGDGIVDEQDLELLNTYIGYNFNIGLPQQTVISTNGVTTTFTNGYETLTQPFTNSFAVQFQLVNSTTGIVSADGYDGVLVANPSDPRLAQFSSASVTFNNIIGLDDYKLVVLNNGNQSDYGGFDIVSLDFVTDTITIRKIFLDTDSINQMLRADIDGDFAVTLEDGYLLSQYIARQPLTTSPTTTYPAPSTNPYTKIGTRFNVIQISLEQYVDRTDDYTANPNTRSTSVHPLPDVFLNDGYYADHDFYHSPITIVFNEQLTWTDTLIAVETLPKFVPSVFTSEIGPVVNSCVIDGIQCNTYPVLPKFDPGGIDFFVPNNLILGNGEIHRPDGNFYKVDFEMGTIVLEIPDGVFGSERTIDILNDFIVDATGDGITKLGFPAMKFADCSYVQSAALTQDQLRFSVAVQSFSPNTNGLSTDGYYGAIVDGKMGVSLDNATGLLTLNFTNLYQDPVLKTLSTKVQVTVFLKKGGFNNMPLFVDSVKLQNMLSLISVFSGANDGGPAALVDLSLDVSNILPIPHGGTGLNAVGPLGTVLTSTGSGASWEPASSGGGPAGGDLSGSYPDPVVVGLQGVPLSSTAPLTNQLLGFNGTTWLPVTSPSTGGAGGDLSGTYPNPTVVAIQNVSISNTTPTNLQVLAFNSISSKWTPTTIPGVGPAGGDLSGIYPNPTVVGIQGTPVSNTAPTTSQVLTFNGTNWAPAAPSGGAPSGVAGGDLGGTYPNPHVTGLQTIPVSPTIPTSGMALIFQSGTWLPQFISGAPPTGAAGGDLSGTYPNPVVSTSNGHVIVTNATGASGDLFGTYPNPTVAKLQGTPVSATTPTSSQVLTYNGTAWAPATFSVFSNANVTLVNGFSTPTYTVTTTDFAIIVTNAPGSGNTIALPTASLGRILFVKSRVNQTTTLTTTGGQTIDGSTTYQIVNSPVSGQPQQGAVQIIGDGSNWNIMYKYDTTVP